MYPMGDVHCGIKSHMVMNRHSALWSALKASNSPAGPQATCSTGLSQAVVAYFAACPAIQGVCLMLGLGCVHTVNCSSLASWCQGLLPPDTRVPSAISCASSPCSRGTVCPLSPHPFVIPVVQQHALLGLRQFLVHLTVHLPDMSLYF